jgi:pimeloyl-ACP methyl ester carboxylesterase
MLFLKSEFKFTDRGFKDNLVLIPGWATDYRIFDRLELDYNYLLTTRLNPFDFNQALLRKLDKLKLNAVAVLGFSLGGFLAAEFAAEFPERISELILLGIRKRYPPEILENIKCAILKNRRVWLYKFYINCFSRLDLPGLGWFKQSLLKEYTEKFSLNELVDGLNYLAGQAFVPKSLAKIKKIKIFHGDQDKIAPLEEAREIKSDLPQAKFILLEDIGHLSFLNPGFRARFYDQEK